MRLSLFLWMLCILLQYGMPAAHAAQQTQREEYQRAGGGALKVRTPAAAPVRQAVVPKTLPELRSLAGADYLCIQRGEFLVASNLGPGEYEYLVDGVLEYCRTALNKTFFDRGAQKKMINIFIFRDYASYEEGLRRFLGMNPISPYGHYGHSQKYIVVNYETGPGTMVHELTHALMSEDFPEAPIWLAEGMASLYEHCRAEGEQLRGDDNWRLPELKDALARGRMIPLATLLSMNPQTFRTVQESLNYAESRYFCKYLEEMGLLSVVYKDFRANHAADPTGARCVARAFGQPLDSVEASWHNWIAFQYWKE